MTTILNKDHVALRVTSAPDTSSPGPSNQQLVDVAVAVTKSDTFNLNLPSIESETFELLRADDSRAFRKCLADQARCLCGFIISKSIQDLAKNLPKKYDGLAYVCRPSLQVLAWRFVQS